MMSTRVTLLDILLDVVLVSDPKQDLHADVCAMSQQNAFEGCIETL